MSEQSTTPDRFPVRQLHGKWEVLLVPENTWLACVNEQDVRAIAAAPVLEYEALDGTRSGPAFARELEGTSNALAKYRIGFGSRFFQRRADEVRRADIGKE